MVAYAGPIVGLVAITLDPTVSNLLQPLLQPTRTRCGRFPKLMFYYGASSDVYPHKWLLSKIALFNRLNLCNPSNYDPPTTLIAAPFLLRPMLFNWVSTLDYCQPQFALNHLQAGALAP